jgi:hypothetical protein
MRRNKEARGEEGETGCGPRNGRGLRGADEVSRGGLPTGTVIILNHDRESSRLDDKSLIPDRHVSYLKADNREASALAVEEPHVSGPSSSAPSWPPQDGIGGQTRDNKTRKTDRTGTRESKDLYQMPSEARRPFRRSRPMPPPPSEYFFENISP